MPLIPGWSPLLLRSLSDFCELNQALMVFTLKSGESLQSCPSERAAQLQMNSSSWDTCRRGLELGASALRQLPLGGQASPLCASLSLFFGASLQLLWE